MLFSRKERILIFIYFESIKFKPDMSNINPSAFNLDRDIFSKFLIELTREGKISGVDFGDAKPGSVPLVNNLKITKKGAECARNLIKKIPKDYLY